MRTLSALLALSVAAILIGCGNDAPAPSAAPPAAVVATPAAAPRDGGTRPVDRSLLAALTTGDAAAARAALAEGADANLDCGRGYTPLILAAKLGDESLVGDLLKAGAARTPDAEAYLGVAGLPARAGSLLFKDLVGMLERLAERKGAPWEAVPGAYAIRMDSRTAKLFALRYHPRFLEKGSTLFLHEQHFGVGGEPDVLLLLPTADKYTVMAAVGVNGANYDIGTPGVMAWCRDLEAEWSFLLIACGSDFLAGHFIRKPANLRSLADAMYAFCPDIVDQGTGSPAALAAEIDRTSQFYLWWD